MSIIYEPSGKAFEYAPLAANIYRGCDHGCTYCYAPSVLRMNRPDFNMPALRSKIIQCLEKEAPAYKGKEILLSFTCDPYQEFDRKSKITRSAIEVLLCHGVKVNILTKGGLRSMRDFDILKPDICRYGASLTFTNDDDSSAYEPRAALPEDRFHALEVAHVLGIPTWASLEPVIDPAQSLEIIDITHTYVDMYKVGKWNHNKEADKIDWKSFLVNVKAKLIGYNKKYYIKKDLAVYE